MTDTPDRPRLSDPVTVLVNRRARLHGERQQVVARITQKETEIQGNRLILKDLDRDIADLDRAILLLKEEQ